MNDTQASPTQQKKKKLTLMFFFASDNTLSPSTIPQLKAIKAAGYQPDTNVIVYFDPNEKGAPTRVFEINKNGDSGAQLVSVLTRDNLSTEDISDLSGAQSEFANALKHIDSLEAHSALDNFLGFCAEIYPADHYMLFLVGHGLVVGRDAFLPDDNPDSAIGLKTLGEILQGFTEKIKDHGVLELLGMHSCSMSAIEVAYQLKGKASYMLASQGLSFVGSWPYRQMLTKIYRTIEQSGAVNVLDLIKNLHSLCIRYNVDFMYAGYSADVCLCSLDPDRVQKLTEPISNLAKALKDGLGEPRCRELIVLAHWRSQSYWQETYTDLYDFCLCLRRLCEQPERNAPVRQDGALTNRSHDDERIAIRNACQEVINKLKPENGSPVDGPVVCTDFVGPDTQYSHGLSIYFPWSQPLEDDNDEVIKRYTGYAFTEELTVVTWYDFLQSYFKKTEREDRLTEEQTYKDEEWKYQNDPYYQKALTTARESFQPTVMTTSRDFFPTSTLEGKVSPPDSSGGACSCASTKNYSRVFSMSPGVAAVFEDTTKSQTATAGGSSPST